MKELVFRTLRAEEIEVRPATIKDGKATLLLYIDSRAVVRLLNETVGPCNWTMEFQEVNGQVVGKMGIWDEEKNQFVYKCDTGSESNIEAQKGLYSDCYKRCLARWGVDELYTAPKIVIDDDGYKCTGYKVTDICYNENREITDLVISNRFGHKMYEWHNGIEQPKDLADMYKKAPTYTMTNEEILKDFCSKKKTEPNIDIAILKDFYEYWLPQANKWNGKFSPEHLWENNLKRLNKAA